GLGRLVQGAHDLGVHVVPQIGAVSANRAFLPPALHDAGSQDAFGNTYVKQVDWDNDRKGDTYRVNANLGHPGFRQFLLDATFRIRDQFGFDGIFLDINQTYHNDPRFNIAEGHLDFAQRCHERYEDFLIFGEHWYDRIQPAYPLVHSVNGPGRGFPVQWGEIFHRYCRTTSHLICPAPASPNGRGSTGVYEQGFLEQWEVDPQSPAIPAIAFVDDTLERNADEVDRRLELARQWGEQRA
ncbi:MAG TPA: hypothetical protein VGC81_03050, partial [Candidatus Methylomirabilis sp.]